VGGNAALYADPLLPEDLAEKIIQVLDEQTRKKLLAHAPSQIRQFELRSICQTWNGLYNELLRQEF
jgi:glycosyltransferase involved in cell wall biosynthesis